MATNEEETPQHLQFLKANDHDLAPLTGTDHKALAAIAAALKLFAYCGKATVLEAVALLAGEMQESTRPLARELIAMEMDWDDRDRYWPGVESHIAQRRRARGPKLRVVEPHEGQHDPETCACIVCGAIRAGHREAHVAKRKNAHLVRDDEPARVRVRHVELELEADDRQLEMFARALGSSLGVDLLELEQKKGGRHG